MLVTGFIEPTPASDLFKVRNGYFASPTYIVLERGGRRDWGSSGEEERRKEGELNNSDVWAR